MGTSVIFSPMTPPSLITGDLNFIETGIKILLILKGNAAEFECGSRAKKSLASRYSNNFLGKKKLIYATHTQTIFTRTRISILNFLKTIKLLRDISKDKMLM